eukprot:scaffold73420_cov30-Phaeocystis_antarctica.AAC.1
MRGGTNAVSLGGGRYLAIMHTVHKLTLTLTLILTLTPTRTRTRTLTRYTSASIGHSTSSPRTPSPPRRPMPSLQWASPSAPQLLSRRRHPPS